MSKDNGRLSRLGVLAPAALSACMDASVLAVPTAGAIISTVLKELSKAFMLKKWFHGSMSAKEAEVLMMERGKNGSFLVRESKTHPGDFVLTVRVRGRVNHVKINKENNKYDVGSGERFDDLVGLIEHFRKYPMVEVDGDVLRLLQPVSGTTLKPTEIQDKLDGLQNSKDLQDNEQECALDGEFQSLQLLDNLNFFTTKEGSKQENACKNRYRNILPYDQTRIVLRRKDEKAACSDYINASYITTPRLIDTPSSSSNESLNSVRSLRSEPKPKKKVFVFKSLSDDALKEAKRCFKLDKINGNSAKQKTYIATQGCLSNTKEDFWRMVWQENVRVIAMITNEVEKGKRKCERYWPHPCEQEIYDSLTVKSISENYHEDYLVRELEVRDEKKSCRTIYQYQFTAWPDHGIPASAAGVLAFMEDINTKLNKTLQSKNGPDQNVICVHCSAGVGRTGTFIVLDILIDKIKAFGYECDIDVYNTVRTLRGQRGGMVQNKAQYRFIYQALRHYVEERPLRYISKVYSIEV
ncbi:tyrosine-protein phosphatase non-receptor type 11 isoform X1 [Plutella xylostella]|uniref:tyrosine-protein phosphatase non-receptor type 11 isoform X1 n=1 Tax=Plutella xylostella TaxID=51655 RepID=UPI0020326585|nr:tyrosine-protein phosphatase non-receptor type 11 isoform X1 [Plutella xylostella]